MKCPFCAVLETKVIDSRLNQTGDITRRRRQCPRCDARFTTYERVEEIMPLVIKKDGRREAYDREKISSGVKKSCQKRSVTSQKMEECVHRIEKRIQSFGVKEIPSRAIGEIVMSELHALDKVAYIRFASVYREFRDLDEFMTEVQAPPGDPADPTALVFPFVTRDPL